MAKIFGYLQKGSAEYNNVASGLKDYLKDIRSDRTVTGIQFLSDINTRFGVNQDYLLSQVRNGNTQAMNLIDNTIREKAIVLNTAIRIENILYKASSALSPPENTERPNLFSERETAIYLMEILDLRKNTGQLLSTLDTNGLNTLLNKAENVLRNIQTRTGGSLSIINSDNNNPRTTMATLDKAIYKTQKQLNLLTRMYNIAKQRAEETIANEKVTTIDTTTTRTSRYHDAIETVQFTRELMKFGIYSLDQFTNIYNKAVELGFAQENNVMNEGIISNLKSLKYLVTDEELRKTIFELRDIVFLECN